jgi:hypothetical protein
MNIQVRRQGDYTVYTVTEKDHVKLQRMNQLIGGFYGDANSEHSTETSSKWFFFGGLSKERKTHFNDVYKSSKSLVM